MSTQEESHRRNVRISGYRPGLAKVAMTKAIRTATGLGLADAKRCTDRVLSGEVVVIGLQNDEAAQALAADLHQLGAIVEVTNDARTCMTQTTCSRCGQTFDESALRNASVPDRNSVIALLANADPDEPMPVEPMDLLDRKLYCPECVRRLNRRRIAVVIAMCVLPLLAAWIVGQWVL